METTKQALREKLAVMPRRIGFWTQTKFMLNGSGLIIFGLFLCLVSVWMGLKDSCYEYTAFRSPATTQGTVTFSEETDTEINEQSLWVAAFTFKIDGLEFNGESFDLGRGPKKGSQSTIEYVVSNPVICRIQGMDYSKLGWGTFIPLGIASIFFLIALFQVKKSLKWGRLLEKGVAACAVLISKERTNTSVNEQMVYKFTFAFDDAVGTQQQFSFKAWDDIEKFTDEEEELMLYNPDNFNEAFLYDQLPFEMKMKEPGVWQDTPSEIIPGVIIRLVLLAGVSLWLFYSW